MKYNTYQAYGTVSDLTNTQGESARDKMISNLSENDAKSALKWMIEAAKESDRSKRRAKQEKEARGRVYLARKIGTDEYKIGRSSDLENRITNLQSHYEEELVVLHTVLCGPTAGTTEKSLKKKYKKYNTHGEWFRFNEAQVNDVIRRMG